jgi:hypothetical protein
MHIYQSAFEDQPPFVSIAGQSHAAISPPCRDPRMLGQAGIDKRAGESDVGRTVDGIVVNNGCHGSPSISNIISWGVQSTPY